MKDTPAKPYSFAPVLTSEDRRKARRLNLTYAVELSGTDAHGRAFSELAKTQDISETGCRICTRIALHRGDIIKLKLKAPPGVRMAESPALTFEIKWVVPERDAWSAGAYKISPDPMFGVSFPPKK